MLRDLLSVALCVTLAATSAVSAQTLAQIGGPKEVPPASFKGDQFVDSRGCIFMRAGVGGTTNWIPRVGANRKVMCGYPPTFGAREPVPVAPDVAVASAPQAPAAAAAAPAVVAGATPGCPANAPYGRQETRADGSEVLKCSTRKAASAAPAPVAVASAPAPAAKPAPAAPVVLADATPGCPPNAPYGRLETRADGRDVLKCFSRKSSAAAPAPVVVASAPPPAPAARPAPAVVPVAAPAAAALPAQSVPARVISTGGPGPGQVACPASMPVLMRVKLTTGGTALLCTPGSQPIVYAAAPTYPPGAGLAPSISPRQGASTAGTTARAAAPRAPAAGTQVATADAMPPLPPGYKRAWTDDRLNPNRGKGTAEGWAQQDQVWTRTVPAEPVVQTKPYVPPPAGAVTVSSRSAKAVAPQVTVSTRSIPEAAAPVVAGPRYVQIGTFGVPANASGAAEKLSSLGLPVATSKTTRNGKSLQIVLAGPFASTAEAQRALSVARGAGFGDAYLR
ncbi:SPOR domain-containing protein [Neotabrizicola shimadae]|uniref:SPOR domain-containing protein n=1 Tax=Neotabrizicola shimadae TaxID=2807096 RepID=A0A8G0ZTZ0_9RHOB|nr:SPOR domain-containing protein [Neotabrizicola shimadae]QYZ68856.1 SPOR domain-containing protein [Neotabrizicola shimadae]